MDNEDRQGEIDWAHVMEERRGATIQSRFEHFHSENPIVYATLVRFAREWRLARTDRCGVGMLWEVMRWEVSLRGLPATGEDFKLNDHYRSRYARLIMLQEPDLADIFETRILRSA